jgi:hypothetical protein
MYGLGSLVKKAVKGVTGAVKGIGKTIKKNPLLAAAAFNFAPMLIPGGASTFLGGKNAMFGLPSFLQLGSEKGDLLKNTLKIGAAGTVLGGVLGGMEGEQEGSIGGERNVGALRIRLEKAYRELGYDEGEIPALVEADLAEYTSGAGGYAEGGRIGYNEGTPEMGMIDPKKVKQAQTMIKMGADVSTISSITGLSEAQVNQIQQTQSKANGGRIGYAMGSPEENAIQASGIMGLPLNENPAGVTELDLRETGGFIPPVGVKEKADDIPAMLSNNEFVMTADAVREFGDGDVNKGAERMYAMMKKLENGGKV